MALEERGRCVLALFESSFERVYRFLRRSTDAETAEEIAQDVFVRLLAYEGIETKPVTVSYLIKIADNLLKRRFRRQQRLGEVLGELAVGVPAAAVDATGGAHNATSSELKWLNAALERLPVLQHEALRLVIADGLTYQEAAHSMGVEVSTINNWKHRGVERLKNIARSDGHAPKSTSKSGRSRRPDDGGGCGPHEGTCSGQVDHVARSGPQADEQAA